MAVGAAGGRQKKSGLRRYVETDSAYGEMQRHAAVASHVTGD